MAQLGKPVAVKIYEGVFARVHTADDPLKYPEGPELRDRAELVRLAREIDGKPITLYHPAEMLAEGGKATVIGRVLSTRLDGDEAIARFVVEDPAGDSALVAGIREMSAGYYSYLDRSGHQRGSRGDHLAIVPAGRCHGKNGTCAVRTDAAEAPRMDCGEDRACGCGDVVEGEAPEVGAGMRARLATPDEDQALGQRLDAAHNEGGLLAARIVPNTEGNDSGPASKELTVNLEEALAALTAANKTVEVERARADQATAERDNALKAKKDAEDAATALTLTGEKIRAEADASKAEAEAEIAKAKTDAADAITKAEAEIATAKQDAASAANERVTVLTNANAVLGTVDAEGKVVDRSAIATLDIKRAIVKHVDGADLPADKSAAYVDARYDIAVTKGLQTAAANAATRAAIVAPHVDAAKPELKPHVDGEFVATQDIRTRLSTAWQTPGTK
jgi:hypothetical protein